MGQTATLRLRDTVARIEGRGNAPAIRGTFGSAAAAVDGRFAVGGPGLDAFFPDGFPFPALHDLFAASARDGGLAAGFLAALLAAMGARRDGTVLWASETLAMGESGVLDGPGLAQFGLDPGRLVLVRSHAPRDILWSLEEGLAAKGMLAVVGEIAGTPRGLDLTASRRLSLRSVRSAVPAFLLRIGGDERALSAARTRWRIAPAPAPSRGIGGETGLLGWPVWRVALVRNRNGRCGALVLGFDAEAGRFFAWDGGGTADGWGAAESRGDPGAPPAAGEHPAGVAATGAGFGRRSAEVVPLARWSRR
jgi:protein ImuA